MMKPSKHFWSDETSSTLIKLNFNVVGKMMAPENLLLDDSSLDDLGLALLSSMSFEDKSEEEHVSDVLQQWDSVIQTLTKLNDSVRSVQRAQTSGADFLMDQISALDSAIGKCGEGPIKEACIFKGNRHHPLLP